MVELNHQRSAANTSVNKMRLDIFVLFNIFNYCRFASYSEFVFYCFNSFWWICDHMWNLVVYWYAIYSLLYHCTNDHFRCTYSSQENHILYRNGVFIILYDLWLLSCLFLLCCMLCWNSRCLCYNPPPPPSPVLKLPGIHSKYKTHE